MAKILYGFSGEGFGHATRTKEVADYLVSAGHQVFLTSYDRGQEYLSKFYPITEISGPRLIYENNQVNYGKTVWKNFLKSRESLRSIEKLSVLIEQEGIEMVISDFESSSALAAKLKHLPLLSLDNQHVLTKTEVETPKAEYKSAYLANEIVARAMVFAPKAYLILSFFPCQPRGKNVFVFNPLVKKEVLEVQPKSGNKILVYLTSASENVVECLKNQPAKFIAYGLPRQGQEGNIIFKATDPQTFLEDLIECRALIATAGFSLISEALYLAKPYLAIPAQLQFEQILNAYHLAKLGFGEHHDYLSSEAVSGFLSRLEYYRANLKNGLRPGNKEVFAKIEELISKYC